MADIMTVSSFQRDKLEILHSHGLSLLIDVLDLPLSTVNFPFERVSVQPADFVYPDYYDFFLLFCIPALSEVFLWFL